MGGGLRILSLDGGGTRGLSSLYTLKEIMNQIVPGSGGNLRPSEYFDIIGASGPNALLALLFVRFAFTIDEALDWFRDFARRMDRAEEIFDAKEGEDLDENDFKNFEKESPKPEVQIETVRRQILSNTWSENITKQFLDWFERSKHMEDGKFNFKNPLADVGIGRCRAAVTGSEAAGYGPNGGVVKDRMYHAPMWHRSYEGRHTQRTYTFYAIALGTAAAPGIVSNGLIFPDFSAPGADIVHNPVQLLLQECNIIWPGLRPKIVLSIGTGKLELPEQWDFKKHPYALTAAKASLKIQGENQKIADDIEKYVLPHDKTLKSAYFRFNVTFAQPFFEYKEMEFILEQTLTYLKGREVATRAARVAELLEEESFPSTWEDQIALSSLASLSTEFASLGYNEEAQLVSDCMSTYILYEPTKIDSGTHRKLLIAASANHMAHLVRMKRSWTGPGITWNSISAPYPPDFFLNSLLAYGEVEGISEMLSLNEPLADLSSMTEIATGCYFLLTAERRRDAQQMNSKLFTSVLNQISKLVFMPAEITQSLIFRMETLFWISSLAALCEQACTEALTAEPRMLLGGQFIRHLTNIILQCNLQHVDIRFLEPVANAISEILRLGKWSTVRDPLIVKLLARGSDRGKGLWSLVNLAVEREAQRVGLQPSVQHAELSECTKLCQQLIRDYSQDFQTDKNDVAIWSVERGYLGLLRKLLEGDDLHSPPRVYAPKPCSPAGSLAGSVKTENGGNLLHRSATKAFIPVLKMIVECLGKVQAPPLLSALDNDGLSPLHICVRRRGDVDTLLLCMYAGVDIDHDSLTGQTALHYCFPNKAEIQDYIPAVENFTREHGLLITLPIKTPRRWGIYGAGREIERPAFALRRMIRQLSCHGANTNVQDRFGATPAHLAAATGWGINIDMLFIRDSSSAEDMARELLQLRDRQNNTVLSVMRTTEDAEGVQIISSEMRKRCLDTSTVNHPQTTPSYINTGPNQHSDSASSSSTGAQRKPLPLGSPIPPTNQPSQAETPKNHDSGQPGLSDEQVARKLQEEWNNEDPAQNHQAPSSQPPAQWAVQQSGVGSSSARQLPIHSRPSTAQSRSPRPIKQVPPTGQHYQEHYQYASPPPPGQGIPAPATQFERPSAIPSNQVPQYSNPFAPAPVHSPTQHPPQSQPQYYHQFAPGSIQLPTLYSHQSQPQFPQQQSWNPTVSSSAANQQPITSEDKRGVKLFKKFLKK